jgi:hypothetical protein
MDDVLESGKVVALNFPFALNPALVRALGVLLKLDFQRAFEPAVADGSLPLIEVFEEAVRRTGSNKCLPEVALQPGQSRGRAVRR